MRAPLVEVFTSIQGEGLYVGCRHLFIRLAGCNLRCAYCDTPQAVPDAWRLERTPGRGDFSALPNPAAVDDVLECLHPLPLNLYHAVSITGGEPLLHEAFLAEMLPRLRRRGWRIYLETNGTLPGALKRTAAFCDIIAMDYKLPSATGQQLYEAEHAAFLRRARGPGLFVKAVVSHDTSAKELAAAAGVIAREAPGTPLVLQPVTAPGNGTPQVNPARLLALQETALAFLPVVRVIPQTHIMLGAR
ncbi:MAG: 7-carboxy-7-deazaguanine synthase QueE [Thermoanaerobacterales bacterium]|nr:7-carboxy-7-deazaguanine synthase QueE [Bacillota bacterium]MDI6906345.1 7-carboxy-7-deazaguanine synthase QueE [Thermoanaerobacterales bacterium]